VMIQTASSPQLQWVNIIMIYRFFFLQDIPIDHSVVLSGTVMSQRVLILHQMSRLVGRIINILTPNVNYSGRTAPLTSKVAFYIFIQQI